MHNLPQTRIIKPMTTPNNQNPAQSPITYDTIIIIPCYNEAARLQPEAFKKFAKLNPQFHFLFVDDGSADATVKVLENLHDANPIQLQLLELEKNQGKALAVQQGFHYAQQLPYKIIGFWDADLATPLSQLPLMREIFDQQTQLKMVFGSRVNLLGRNVERKIFRHYLGRIFATCAAFILELPIYDTQCGAKLFKSDFKLQQIFRDPFASKWCFDVEILARYIALIKGGTDNDTKMKDIIYEFPLHQWQDVGGSKMKWYDFIKGPYQLFKIFTTYK